MKKFICVILVSISFIFLLGCDKINLPINNEPETKVGDDSGKSSDPLPQDKSSGQNQSKSSYSIKDYYPFKETTKYEYEGIGNEYATYTVFVDYIKDSRIQLRKNNGGTEAISVIENKNGELKNIFSKEESYFREDFTSKPSNKDEILLKEPLVKGTSWTLKDGSKRYISNVDIQVTTPIGNFKALEVTTEGKDSKTVDYYGLNAGLIKSVFSSNGMEVSSTLIKVAANTPLTQNVKFYYPNGTDEKIYFIEKKLEFKTNDMTKVAFEKTFKEPPTKNVGKLLGPNAKIKSLYLNGDVVYVDFTKELVSEMNAGVGYETMILQCITNTLGGYYKVNKVYITIEGNPYSSGHISMKKGQTFTVNVKNTVQLKK